MDSVTRYSQPAQTQHDNFYTNLLQNRISELEKQLPDKNAIIDFLSAQFISKTPDLQKNKRSDNGQVNNKSDYDGLSSKKSSDDRTKNVIIIGDSVLNNVNSCELSKSKKVEDLNFTGATSTDIFKKMDDILEDKPQSLIVHAGTNDLTNDVNLLNNVKKIVNETKKKSPNTVISFSNIIIRKDRNNLDKYRADKNSRLKTIISKKKYWINWQ